MDYKKALILIAVLISSISISSVLIWHGLNLDLKEKQPEVLGSLNPVGEETKPSTPSAQVQKSFLVTKVIDGDTIEIKSDGLILKVRLIGIDTPETVDPRRPVGCFGKKASAETKRLIEGKHVILTKDVSETDKYNRLLRYVFLPIREGENLFINDYLIRQGFAKILTYPPDIKYDSRFLQAQKEAKDNLRGLWGECR